MNALKGSTEIKLLVNNEHDLYTPLSPDNEFSHGIKSYIKSKAACADYNSNINLKVICSSPIDEEKFRSTAQSSAYSMNGKRTVLLYLNIPN